MQMSLNLAFKAAASNPATFVPDCVSVLFLFMLFFAAEKSIPSATAANSETCCLPLCNQCTTLQPIWTVPQETIIQWHTERLMWKMDLCFLQSTPNQLERFAADCSDSLDDWPFLRRYICAGADGSRDENTVFHSLSSPSSFWEEEGGWLARWDEMRSIWCGRSEPEGDDVK